MGLFAVQKKIGLNKSCIIGLYNYYIGEFEMMDAVEKGISIRKSVLNSIIEELQSYIYTVCVMLQETLNQGGKVVLFGVGKDLSIAKYFANELTTKFADSKSRFPAVVLNPDLVTMDTFGMDEVFEREMGAVAISKDMLIGIAIDGQNKACLRTLSLGKNLGCRVIGFSGKDDDIMSEFCDVNIALPSDNQDIAREMAILVGGVVFSSVKTFLMAEMENYCESN